MAQGSGGTVATDDHGGALGIAETIAHFSDEVPAQGAPPTPPPADEARFVAQHVLGEGGMGRVVSAQDQQFGRLVAVKELKLVSPGLIARFNIESLVTANLEHPGVPAVYARGLRSDGAPYYAMRQVVGKTLADAIVETKGRTDRLKLIAAVTSVARTVGFAHSHGVVHRDIKPENVILGKHGETVLLDWGIAKVRGLDSSHGSEVLDRIAEGSQQTQLGAVMGTPAYMAPEQARGDVHAIDERTDVFAVGAMLYHVLTGTAPYAGNTAADVVSAATQAACQPVSHHDPNLPAGLLAIVERAMAPAPADRFATAVQLAEALEDFAAGVLATQKPPLAVRLLSAAGAAGLLVVTLLGATSIWALTSLLELGFGAYFYIALALFGGILGVTEWLTKGRHHLAPLVLAFAACTALAGIVAACLGWMVVFTAASTKASDAEKWRFIVAEGTRETIGNLPVSMTLTAVLIALWALGRRRALTSAGT